MRTTDDVELQRVCRVLAGKAEPTEHDRRVAESLIADALAHAELGEERDRARLYNARLEHLILTEAMERAGLVTRRFPSRVK